MNDNIYSICWQITTKILLYYIIHWFNTFFFDGSVVCEKRAIFHDKKLYIKFVDDNWWTECG